MDLFETRIPLVLITLVATSPNRPKRSRIELWDAFSTFFYQVWGHGSSARIPKRTPK
jgi:hypothetical protein